MSTISNLGARLPSLFTGSQADAKSPALQKTQGVSATNNNLSSKGLDLDSRVASIGNATVDFAQDFVNSFTQALFGDAAKGATIDFDSASLEASSSVAVGYQHTSGANGTTDAAAFSLTDSSHFIGKGTITTADGRKFDFEVEVQYNAELNAAASQTSKADDADAGKPQSSTKDLPTVQVPNIDFPGTLSDLFKLIGRDLQTALSTSNNSNDKSDSIDRNTLRGLSLRLLNLVDSKDTNTYAAPTAADKAKAAANAADTPASPPAAEDTTAAATTRAASDAAAAASNDAAPADKAAT
jgi:hypothetical protein